MTNALIDTGNFFSISKISSVFFALKHFQGGEALNVTSDCFPPTATTVSSLEHPLELQCPHLGPTHWNMSPWLTETQFRAGTKQFLWDSLSSLIGKDLVKGLVQHLAQGGNQIMASGGIFTMTFLLSWTQGEIDYVVCEAVILKP